MRLSRVLAVFLVLSASLAAPEAVAGDKEKRKKKDVVWQPDPSGCRNVQPTGADTTGEWDHDGWTPLGSREDVYGGAFSFTLALDAEWSGVEGERPCPGIHYTFEIYDQRGRVAETHVVDDLVAPAGASGTMTISLSSGLETVNTECVAVDITISEGPFENGLIHDQSPVGDRMGVYEDLCTWPLPGSPGRTWN